MAVVRILLVVSHLVFFALAMATVLYADWQCLRNRLPSRRRMLQVGRHTRWWFAGLLASGAALVWIDTGFSLDQILANPKLMAKLSVVALLSLNGCLLHAWGLNAMTRPSRRAAQVATALALIGAVSSSSWAMATLLGVSKPLVPMLGYAGFMAIYAALFSAAVIVALVRIRPLLVRRLQSPVTGFDTAPATLTAAPSPSAGQAEPQRLAA